MMADGAEGGLEEWIGQLISEDRVHDFYVSPAWRRISKAVLKANNYECARCKAKGLVTRANTVHHKQYLRSHPELALDMGNLEPICPQCHFEEHHKEETRHFTNEERW